MRGTSIVTNTVIRIKSEVNIKKLISSFLFTIKGKHNKQTINK